MGGRESFVCSRLSTRCCGGNAKKSGPVERTDETASTRGKLPPPSEAGGINRYRLRLDHRRWHSIDGRSCRGVVCDGGKSCRSRLGDHDDGRPPGVKGWGRASVVGRNRPVDDRCRRANRSRAADRPGINGNRKLRAARPRCCRCSDKGQKSQNRRFRFHRCLRTSIVNTMSARFSTGSGWRWRSVRSALSRGAPR